MQELTDSQNGDGVTRVFVAEDHPLYREGLVESIGNRPELELVGEAGNGRQALEQIRELEPDVALLDLKLPELDGISVLREMGGNQAETRALLLSAYVDGDLILEALEAGAAGYLSKDAVGDEVFAAIRAAASGERVLSPGLEQRLAEEISRRNDEKSRLSFRETEILELMAEGLPNPAIGERLNISESTVKSYTRRAFEKLGVSSRGAAIAEAMRRGIFT
jgi:two-component system, NarL family, nitrate/nitrite response regulator NarL